MDTPPPDTLRAITAVQDACAESERALKNASERRVRIITGRYCFVRRETRTKVERRQ